MKIPTNIFLSRTQGVGSSENKVSLMTTRVDEAGFNHIFCWCFFHLGGVTNISLLLNCLSLPILQVCSWFPVRGAPCLNRVQGFLNFYFWLCGQQRLQDIVIQERLLLRDSPTSASSVPRKGKSRTRNCLPPSPTPHIWRKPGGLRGVINKICTSTYPTGGAKLHFFANDLSFTNIATIEKCIANVAAK